MDQDRFDVFVGLDVGEGHHHATAINTAGKRVHDKAALHCGESMPPA